MGPLLGLGLGLRLLLGLLLAMGLLLAPQRHLTLEEQHFSWKLAAAHLQEF
jgi:hypothetical protein